MSNNKLRHLFKVFIIVGFSFSLWVVPANTDSQNLSADTTTTSSQARISVPVTAKQLDPANGVVPISLNCEESVLIVPNTLDRIPCTIKNNSGRVMTALVLGTFVSLDNNGTISTQSGYVTIDTFIHADLHLNQKQNKGIRQNAEPQFPLATESYSGIVTRVQVYVDYVELDDKKTLGPNRAGAGIIAGLREGAKKYKSWLVKEFELKGKSVVALARLIGDNQPVPAEVGIRSSSEEQGAVIYRNWLRRIHKTEGVQEFEKYFNYQNTSNN